MQFLGAVYYTPLYETAGLQPCAEQELHGNHAILESGGISHRFFDCIGKFLFCRASASHDAFFDCIRKFFICGAKVCQRQTLRASASHDAFFCSICIIFTKTFQKKRLFIIKNDNKSREIILTFRHNHSKIICAKVFYFARSRTKLMK